MSTIEPVKFGTDGLRGRAGQAPMEPATLRRVGAALGVLLQRGGDGSQRRVATILKLSASDYDEWLQQKAGGGCDGVRRRDDDLEQ